MQDIIRKCAEEYTKGCPLISDERFDLLLQSVERAQPSAKVLTEVGSTGMSSKVVLPIHMRSMNKLKDSRDFCNWKKKYSGPYNISSKMDGISLLIDGDKAYTRGNGEKGKDVTWIKEAMCIPSTPKDVMVRGELIISICNWQKLIEDYGEVASTPLAFVAGYAHHKNPDLNMAGYLSYVTFQLIENYTCPPVSRSTSNQQSILSSMGYEIVQAIRCTDLIWDEMQNLLNTMREKSPYILDGVIISHDEAHIRNDDANPSHAVAYKDFVAIEATVNDIKWTESPFGVLTPVAMLDPVMVDGKVYRKVTANNAKYVVDNMIGPGAIIMLGINITPNIKGVITGSEPNFPDMEYKWEGVDIIATEGTYMTRVRSIVRFMEIIGVEGLKLGNVVKLYNNGYMSISCILSMSKDDMYEVLGANSEKIYPKMIEMYDSASDVDIMAGSGFFKGLNKLVLEPLFEVSSYEDILFNGVPNNISGLGDKRRGIIEDNMQEFLIWLDTLPSRKGATKRVKKETTQRRVNVMLTGSPPKGMTKKTFIEMHPWLKETGKWSDVELLITNDLSSCTDKMNKARDKGIDITTYEAYML